MEYFAARHSSELVTIFRKRGKENLPAERIKDAQIVLGEKRLLFCHIHIHSFVIKIIENSSLSKLQYVDTERKF
jgi:hypothetical protein